MSANRTSDDADDANLPAVERDAVSTGAAADSADSDERLKGLPRILRFAMLISGNARHIKQRLIAEINELCPNLPLNAAWAAAPDVGTRLALAAELDRRPVTRENRLAILWFFDLRIFAGPRQWVERLAFDWFRHAVWAP